MTEWSEISLGELFKVKHGFAFKGEFFCDHETKEILVTPGNFSTSGGFQNVKQKFYNGPVPEDYILRPGDLVITMTDLSKEADTLGFGALIPDDNNIWLHNQRIGRVELHDESSTDLRFLNYILRSRDYRGWIVGSATGTTVKHTAPKKIEAFQFKIPPLPEQKAIAHILGSLDEKIELNRKMNQTLEAMAQALFKSWFVDFDPVIDNALAQGKEIPEELEARAEKRRRVIANREERSGKQSPSSPKPLLSTNPSLAAQFPASFVFNETLGKWIPEGWEVRTIKEFGKVVCGKTPSKSNPDFYGGSIPFVKIPNMHNEVFVLSTDEYLSEKGSESQANKLIPPGSISVSCIATVGKVIITNQPCHTNQQINSVVPNELIYRYFLYFTMLNLERHFHDLASAGSTTLNMNTSTFSNISILFPSKEVLSEFNKLVFPKFSKILQNQMEKETLTNLRDRLLPELISGRVRVEEFKEVTEQELAMVAERKDEYKSKS